MTAYYNEHDTYAAQWLRNLIDAGEIAPGDVDERSIEDVLPSELAGYTQCHFFAGVGVWSYALRQAGWPDDRPVWTGSCPCQPFSTAGKGAGAADERHLWPSWFHLIQERRPDTVFGEQVEAAIRHGWLDLVQSDLEGVGYAVGFAGIPAAGVGAPHIRQRLWFVANNNNKGLEGWQRMPERAVECAAWAGGVADGVANAQQCLLGRETESTDNAGQKADGPSNRDSGRGGTPYWLVHPDLNRRETWRTPASTSRYRDTAYPTSRTAEPAGPVNGHWRDVDWISCRDGKWRPIEPGTTPLASRTPNHVGRLRAYGNAICAPVAQAFIESFLDQHNEKRT